MDFEVFDFIEPKYSVNVVVYPKSEHFFYIKKDTFDNEISIGQETKSKTLNQVALDIPRSNVYIDGEKIFEFPNNISLNLARYCTQTVMGLPVELLTYTGIVAEPAKPHRLSINIWGETVYIKKNLRIFTKDGCIPVKVHINADMHNPCVIIKIKSGCLQNCEDVFAIENDANFLTKMNSS